MTSARATSSLILASASPRRLDLLRQISIEPNAICPAGIDESPQSKEKPRAYVRRLAQEKAAAIKHDDAYVLGADTIVVLGRRILGKPNDAAHAREMLCKLSGRKHNVFTGIALKAPDGQITSRMSTSQVWFKRLNPTEIERYIATGEWQGKAGAYGIQGFAEQFVKKMNGSYSGIVGLPLYETSCLMHGAGFALKDDTL